MEINVTFDSDIGLVEKLISAEVIHFGIGSPIENRQLFIVRQKFHRGPYMDKLLYRVGSDGWAAFAINKLQGRSDAAHG